VRTHSIPAAVTLALLLHCGAGRLGAWGHPIHDSITRAAIDSLPEWQKQRLAPIRDILASRYSVIPDIWVLPEYRKEFGPLVVFPDGTRFTHAPYAREHTR